MAISQSSASKSIHLPSLGRDFKLIPNETLLDCSRRLASEFYRIWGELMARGQATDQCQSITTALSKVPGRQARSAENLAGNTEPSSNADDLRTPLLAIGGLCFLALFFVLYKCCTRCHKPTQATKHTTLERTQGSLVGAMSRLSLHKTGTQKNPSNDVPNAAPTQMSCV